MSIGAKTQTCGIFGHPVGHSLSPAMHNAAFQALGLDFVYVAHDVLPDDLPSAIAGARAMGYRGLSITIPHKVAAISLVDAVDHIAEGIGCINTIVNDAGKLKGYNSDGLGALSALKRSGAHPTRKNVVILGSGGAARAIAMTLALESPPATLRILGVDAREMDRLVGDLRVRTKVDIGSAQLDDKTRRKFLSSADLLLQTSPVGMAPHTDRTPIPVEELHPNLVVFDAVYNPRRTRLLRDALSVGARVVEGQEMFLGQALTQFRLFTEHEPPENVMRSVVESNLGA